MGMLELIATSGGAKILGGLAIAMLIFGILGFIIYKIVRKKYIYNYKFMLVTQLGHFMSRKGRITKNKQGVEVFEIDGIPEKYLDIKEPNMIINGKYARVIAYDGQGSLAWCDKIKVDKKAYMETALIAPERQMAAQAAMDARSKYGKIPLEAKFMMGATIILIFVVVIGLYANGKLTLETVESASKSLTIFEKASESQAATLEAIKHNNEVLFILLKHNGIDLNYTITEVAE